MNVHDGSAPGRGRRRLRARACGPWTGRPTRPPCAGCRCGWCTPRCGSGTRAPPLAQASAGPSEQVLAEDDRRGRRRARPPPPGGREGHHRGAARGTRYPPAARGTQRLRARPGHPRPQRRHRAAARLGEPGGRRPRRLPGDRRARRPRAPGQDPDRAARRARRRRRAETSAAVRLRLPGGGRRGTRLCEAVRAWRCPAHESTDHPLLAGEPARLHEQQAAEVLEDGAAGRRRGASVGAGTPADRRGTGPQGAGGRLGDADLLVVGARRRHGHFGLQLGRVAHAVLHHSACPVAVVPQRA